MARQPDDYFERDEDEDGIRLKGHHIWLEDVLGMYLSGMTPEQIAADYYTMSLEEAQAAVAYTYSERV